MFAVVGGGHPIDASCLDTATAANPNSEAKMAASIQRQFGMETVMRTRRYRAAIIARPRGARI
jgi:trehalose-6-phosphate synthase